MSNNEGKSLKLNLLYQIQLILYCIIGERLKLEYWNGDDEEVETDIQKCMGQTPDLPPVDVGIHGLDNEHTAIIWWLVVFTCTLQTLHSLPLQAVEWLLKFLAVLLTYLGSYANKIADIARIFPPTLYLRTKYLKDKLRTIPVVHKVVCPTCHSLYGYAEFL